MAVNAWQEKRTISTLRDKRDCETKPKHEWLPNLEETTEWEASEVVVVILQEVAMGAESTMS
jgi:hypothetical protein